MKGMRLLPLHSTLFRANTALDEPIIYALSKARVRPRDGDILAVASKAVAISEGAVELSANVRVSAEAARYAKRYNMDMKFVQTVMDDADTFYNGVPGAILTLKDGDAVANAGADQKNAPPGTIVLWPKNPDRSARRLRRRLEGHYRKRLGVVIVDSRVTPMRLGTVGLALACAGFNPVIDIRGKPDLYGRTTRITRVAVGDGIADAAHLLMGESTGLTPFVLVRNSPATIDGRNRPRQVMQIPPADCLYMSNLAR